MGTITVHVEQVNATTSRGTARQHSLLVDRPIAKNGTDAGAMGGELMLLGLGGCFMSSLLAAIRAREADISEIAIEVVAVTEDDPTRFTAIELQIAAHYADEDLMHKLVTIAERGCLVSNTLRSAVALTTSIRRLEQTQ